MRPLLLLILLCTVFLCLAFVPFSSPCGEADKVLSALEMERETPWETVTVTLPESTDAVWKPYLALQAETGYDMAAYSGKTVTRLTCKIANHPKGEHVYANLFWADGKIIGGDIMSPALDGFLHGLEKLK